MIRWIIKKYTPSSHELAFRKWNCSKTLNCSLQKIIYKVQVSAYNFIKKDTLAQVFSCELLRNSKEQLFHRIPPGDCFCNINLMVGKLRFYRADEIFISDIACTTKIKLELFEKMHIMLVNFCNNKKKLNKLVIATLEAEVYLPIHRWLHSVYQRMIILAKNFSYSLNKCKNLYAVHLHHPPVLHQVKICANKDLRQCQLRRTFYVILN